MVASTAIISPFWDAFCTGGLSLAMFAIISVSFSRVTPDSAVALFVFNLSFLVNFPHFLSSYQLMYGDFRHKIFTDTRFMIAGILVPLVLAVGMAWSFVRLDSVSLGYFLVAMYFFVGWHYVKQTFGIIVVANAYRKIFYSKRERFWLQANMYSLWAVSFFHANAYANYYNQMGIDYPSLNLSAYPLQVAYFVLGLSVAATVYLHVRKYIVDGSVFPASSVMAYATIYLFLHPLATHPMYAHMAPFFHSLQYLLFVYAYRRNKIEDEIEDVPAIEARSKRVIGIGGFFVGSIVLGALAFTIVPGFFDMSPLINRALFGATPFVFFATVLINIHHYFIDNVIWKGSNPEIREHLFRAA